MEKIKKIIIAIIAVLAIGNVYFIIQCFTLNAQLVEANKIILARQTNEKILAFSNLFVDKVLSGQQEVSFEDRLQLENSVRSLNDQEIFDQWQKFVKSGINEEGQKNLSKLLKLLLSKIY